MVALLAVLAGLAGHGTAAAHSRSPACEAPEAYTLDNGVEVRLRVDHSLPAVAVVSSLHAGARHDPRGHEGLAHYVEHLTFRLSPAFASVTELDGLAGAIHRNATTSRDTTDYFSVVPPEQLELALWIEARRLAVGLDTVDEQQALDERKVVLREHVLRFGPGAELTRMNALAQAIYADGHPYRRPSQSIESQEHLSLGAARWFFGRHYRPERVRVVLVGDFQPDQAKALIARLFGTLRARETAPGGSLPELGDAGPAEECRLAAQVMPVVPRRIVVATPDRRERLVFAWPVPVGADGAAALGPLSAIGARVRLAATESGLADHVVYGLDPSELGQIWSLTIEPIPGRPFEKVSELARSELTRLAQQVPDADALVALRQGIELEDARTGRALLDRAKTLARRECHPSACVSAATAVTADQFTRASRLFDPRQAVVIESRYRQFARPQGDVESLPLESGVAP